MLSGRTRHIVNVLCITCLLLDSGGGLGLRNVAFLIIFGYAFWSVYRNALINKAFIMLYGIFIISILPAIYVSINNAIPIGDMMIWVVAFLLIPFLYLYAKESRLDSRAFVTGGVIFSVIILLLFFGRLFDVTVAVDVNNFISDRSNGFFHNKEYVSGDVLPNVYFQGTLGLVICGTVCLEQRKNWSFVLILIALILAPSRFGFLVLCAWAAFLFLRRSPARVLYLPFVVPILFIILNSLAFGTELLGAFTGQGDDSGIRSGHLKSIYEILSNDISGLFFGQGPGSIFFSKGFNYYTDNIEMSQVEYIRKYGILSFAAFNLFYFWPIFSKKPNTFTLKGALVVYYLVSFSNPVLFSIFAMLFLTFAYIKISEMDAPDLQNSLSS